MKPSFTTTKAAALWASYFSRIDSIVELLPLDIAQELKSDIADHLAQAYVSRNSTSSELIRLQVAIERMGKPEEYLRETVADYLIEKGTTGIAPLSLARGLVMDIARGGRSAVLALLFTCGFVVIVSFIALAILSPFLPMYVGFLDMPDGSHLLGFSRERGAREHLGWWRIPIGMVGGASVWYGLARLLRVMRR